MNDSRNEIRVLWCRQLSGEQLDDTESQRLRKALREDSELLQELSDDATSHALLRSLKEVPQTDDLFVQAVMQQVTTDAPLAKDDSMISMPVIESQVTTSPEHHSLRLPKVADDQRSNDLRGVRRRSQQWLSLVLTLALFVSVGLIFWSQSQQQTEVAGTGPSTKELTVEQKSETSLQGGRPDSPEERNVAATEDASPVNAETSKDVDNSHIQIATSDNTPAPRTTEGNRVGAETPRMAEETPPTSVAQPFAMLTKVENPVWEREDKVGARFGDEVVRLFGGTMELTFDDGAVVTLEGPVEFQPRSASLIELHRGQLSATVPKPAIGFTVVTPTSQVIDLGTEFDVSVKDTGASDVVIKKGEVEVAPGGRTGRNIQKWKLVPGGLNRASFYARPDSGKPGPIVAKVEGARGQFQGIISIDGKTAKFRSEDTFDNIHERVLAQLKNPQSNTQRQWQEFVDSLQSKMRGTMNFNGRQMQFGNLDEVMRLHNQLQNQLKTNTGTPFTGSININGKVIQFKTRKEFEAARRTAFGPAANFGAGDILDTQRGQRRPR